MCVTRIFGGRGKRTRGMPRAEIWNVLALMEYWDAVESAIWFSSGVLLSKTVEMRALYSFSGISFSKTRVEVSDSITRRQFLERFREKNRRRDGSMKRIVPLILHTSSYLGSRDHNVIYEVRVTRN